MKNITIIPAVIASLILLLLFVGMLGYDRLTSAAVAAGSDQKTNFQIIEALCVGNKATFIFKNIGDENSRASTSLFKEIKNGNVDECQNCDITSQVIAPGEFVQGYCKRCSDGQHVFQITANETKQITLSC